MRAIGGHNLSPPSLTPMMASSEVVEIILLDVYGNQHVRVPQHQQYTIDLFEELPGGLNGDVRCDEEDELWEDYLTNLH